MRAGITFQNVQDLRGCDAGRLQSPSELRPVLDLLRKRAVQLPGGCVGKIVQAI